MIQRLPTSVRFVTGHTEEPLPGWRWRKEPARENIELGEWAGGDDGWRDTRVPGREPDFEQPSIALDHWYRCRFSPAIDGSQRQVLRFDGLTPADIWLNGRLLFRTDNMFHAHAYDVTTLLASTNDLLIRFRSLQPLLGKRRPRGRWPTRLVSHKNLRFVRSTLLGHMSGWCPGGPHIGPWRPIHLVHQRSLVVTNARLSPTWTEGAGNLTVALSMRLLDSEPPTKARLVLDDAIARPLVCIPGEMTDEWMVTGSCRMDEVSPWWPHTHGAPRLYRPIIELTVGEQTVQVGMEPIGFRCITRSGSPDDFQLHCNGIPIFCRGGSWIALDPVRLHAAPDEYQTALEQVRDAGMNMVRIPGIAVYESDDFFRACDRLGILVWQDFMFANMDYPVDDPGFLESCTVEARQQIERVRDRPSLAVLCGNSEVAQQAAMMGLPKEAWSNAFFDEILPDLCREVGTDIPYVPSSPWGKTLPFHPDRGPSHYYGVGAYRRPVEDVWAAGVRFASECLAFSHPPDTRDLLVLMGDAGLALHHPRYKAHVPRDPGAGWDFADVTDHYVEQTFGTPSLATRASDPERYLALCRVAVGTIASRTIGIWRRDCDPCAGTLVWHLRDLAPGAGWGIIGHDGRPKSIYHYLKRAWAKTAVWLVDEGLSGLTVHAANDSALSVRGPLHVLIYRSDGKVVASHVEEIELSPHRTFSWSVEALLGFFVDPNYVYRFGPLGHEIVVARLEPDVPFTGDRAALRAFFRPGGPSSALRHDVELTAIADLAADGSYEVTLCAPRPLQAVTFDCPDYQPSDDHFDLEPNQPYQVTLRPRAGARSRLGRVQALDLPSSVAIDVRGGFPT